MEITQVFQSRKSQKDVVLKLANLVVAEIEYVRGLHLLILIQVILNQMADNMKSHHIIKF